MDDVAPIFPKFKMLRLRVIVALAAALLSWPVSMHGQRLPTRSADLHNLRSDRVRVIVQADTSGLRSVRSRLSRALRREMEGATALDLTRAELETLARDSSVVHISKDLPVVADMAVTNKVTRADSVWQGTPRPAARDRRGAGNQGPDRRRGDRLGHLGAQRHRIASGGQREMVSTSRCHR